MVTSTWELHFEKMLPEQHRTMEGFIQQLMSHAPDAIDYMIDEDGCLHVMFEDLKHLHSIIGACDHRTRLHSMTVDFSVNIGDQLRSWNKDGASMARAKIDLPWQADDRDHGSIELVTD